MSDTSTQHICDDGVEDGMGGVDCDCAVGQDHNMDDCAFCSVPEGEDV